VEWTLDGEALLIVPVFTLYDYSFRPARLTRDAAIEAARRFGTSCADEHYLLPGPYSSCEEWSAARIEATRDRLGAIPGGQRIVLVSHFPLRHDLARVPTLPLFSLWCGSEATEPWPVRHRAALVISGHLHRPSARRRDAITFLDVSAGYPRERRWEPLAPVPLAPFVAPLPVTTAR